MHQRSGASALRPEPQFVAHRMRMSRSRSSRPLSRNVGGVCRRMYARESGEESASPSHSHSPFHAGTAVIQGRAGSPRVARAYASPFVSRVSYRTSAVLAGYSMTWVGMSPGASMTRPRSSVMRRSATSMLLSRSADDRLGSRPRGEELHLRHLTNPAPRDRSTRRGATLLSRLNCAKARCAVESSPQHHPQYANRPSAYGWPVFVRSPLHLRSGYPPRQRERRCNLGARPGWARTDARHRFVHRVVGQLRAGPGWLPLRSSACDAATSQVRLCVGNSQPEYEFSNRPLENSRWSSLRRLPPHTVALTDLAHTG